jgi:hypothetical protein
MGKENGFEFTPKDGGIGMPEQENTPYVDFSVGDKMRRSPCQEEIFDNNGGDSKAEGAGVVNNNANYGPVTYGF